MTVRFQTRMKDSPAEKDPARSGGLIGTLATLGVTPNMVSYAGFAFAIAAAIALAIGAGDPPPWRGDPPAGPSPTAWPLIAALFLGLSAAADLLDGALARGAGLQTRYGALLDSTLDRFGDVALYAGCAIHFAAAGNVTFVALSFLAAAAAVQVSYVKARGENLVSGLGVGFWQRGERISLLLVGALSGSIPSALVLLALFPLFTVGRRRGAAREKIEAADRGEPSPTRPVPRLQPPWQRSRRSAAFWAFCVALTAAVIAGPWIDPLFAGSRDPLGDLLRARATSELP